VSETTSRAERAANLFDLRRIIGGVFLVWGVLLIILGLTDSEEEANKAAGININLWAGIGMFIVGAIFLAWALTRPLGTELREAGDDEPGGSPTRAAPRGVDAASLGSEQARRTVRGDHKGTVRPDDPGGK
jgi:hypothetical protein